jgi:hypothetical protein
MWRLDDITLAGFGLNHRRRTINALHQHRRFMRRSKSISSEIALASD